MSPLVTWIVYLRWDLELGLPDSKVFPLSVSASLTATDTQVIHIIYSILYNSYHAYILYNILLFGKTGMLQEQHVCLKCKLQGTTYSIIFSSILCVSPPPPYAKLLFTFFKTLDWLCINKSFRKNCFVLFIYTAQQLNQRENET